jgi:hypothetical protein
VPGVALERSDSVKKKNFVVDYVVSFLNYIFSFGVQPFKEAYLACTNPFGHHHISFVNWSKCTASKRAKVLD